MYVIIMIKILFRDMVDAIGSLEEEFNDLEHK